MKRLQWLAAGTAVMVCGFMAGVADAADSALALVPGSAPIVIHVRGIERTKDRLVTMIKNALPEFAPMVQNHVDEMFKKGIDERELKGVSKDKSAFLVFTEMPAAGQEVPMVAAIVPVTNYDQFRDGVLKEEERKSLKKESGYETTKANDKDIFFVKQSDYAIVTSHKDVAVQFTKKQPGLDAKLNQETVKKILAADVSIYVNMESVNKEYADQIKQFHQLIPVILGQMQGQVDKNAMKMFESMYEGVFQFVEDSRSLLVAADFRPEGLAFSTQARVGADTKSNGFLKNMKPGALDNPSKLSTGQMGYMAINWDADMFKTYLPFVLGVVTGDDTKKELKEAFALMSEAGPRTMIGDFNLPVQGLQVATYKDPAKAVEGQLQIFKALEAGATFGNAPLKGKPTIKPDAESYRDFKFNAVTLQFDFEKLGENIPGAGGKEVGAVMKKLMGETMNGWVGTDGKVVVSLTAKDWKTAQQNLDNYLDGKNTVGHVKAFSDSAKQMPMQSTMLGFMDMPLYVARMSEIMGPVLKGQGLPINIPVLKATPGKSYMGISLKLQPEHGSFELWLPVTTVQEIKKMIQPILGDTGIQ